MDERERGLAAALDQVRGVDIDEAAARAHVLRPGHLRGVASDRGREGVPVKRLFWPPVPVLYRFDVSGFIRELEEQLTGNVAGYSIRLTENGSTIALAGQNWAKEPQDGSQSWTPDTRMHVASLSKIVTAIAMTRQGVAFFLPLNMELVVLVNSPVGEGPAGQFLYTVVSDAYAAHIEEVLVPPVASASSA